MAVLPTLLQGMAVLPTLLQGMAALPALLSELSRNVYHSAGERGPHPRPAAPLRASAKSR